MICENGICTDMTPSGIIVKDITSTFVVRPVNLGEERFPKRKPLQEYVDDKLNKNSLYRARLELACDYTGGRITTYVESLVRNYLNMIEDCTDGYTPGVKLRLDRGIHKVTFFNRGNITEMATSDFYIFNWKGKRLSISEVQKVIKPNWMELIKIKINEWIEQRQCDTYDLV